MSSYKKKYQYTKFLYLGPEVCGDKFYSKI